MTAKNHLVTEESVRSRYSRAARQTEGALCCPVTYDPNLLAVIPDEVLERDYGCGDPTPYIHPGETVLDLGSGGGKVCFIAAQVVGREGRVIGVDCNRDMLALARKHQPAVAQRLGFSNIDFRCGLIQDLRLDLDRLAADLAERPVGDQYGWLEMRGLEDRLRKEAPLIPNDSVDVVVSNCVLNLVRPEDRVQLFGELFRVLRKGGRAVICDIASDEDIPEAMRADPELWSGCISGAHREDLFLEAFAEAGFHGVELLKREAEPWRVVNGIEFRSLTVRAYKGKQGPCLERKQALIYRGPFRSVEDDDGHTYARGERTAVCDKTFHLLQSPPYQGMFEPVEPHQEISLEDAEAFDCSRPTRREAHETKGQGYDETTDGDGNCCGSGGCC